MHIILDANIYAADYRFSGVAFRTLFDYIRRTESTLVLPRTIREEVVCGFGRRLKKESREFFEAYRRYKLLDVGNVVPEFHKPDIRKAMNQLRRKLMKPSDNVTPVYVAETSGISVDEVFMHGVHRTRPANDAGEELRDVIIWLWVLYYSGSAPENVAFVSQDTTFWQGDEPHPKVALDISNQKGRLSIHRTIDQFLKKHAPAPVDITPEWFSEHFKVADFERESVEAATRELNGVLFGFVRDVRLDEIKFVSGSLYEITPSVQFTELNVSLLFGLTHVQPKYEQRLPLLGLGSLSSVSLNWAQSVPLSPLVGQPEPMQGWFLQKSLVPMTDLGEMLASHLHPKADARFSARIKENKVAEVSLDQLKLDTWDILSQQYKTKPEKEPMP
jgi:hypothetical protein